PVLVLLAACALLALTACGGGGVSSDATPATQTPHASVQQVTHTASAPDGSVSGGITASAICPGGEALLSGGYSIQAPDQAKALANILSYPSAGSAWTVNVTLLPGDGGATTHLPVTLTVVADCLKANFPVSTQIVQNSMTPPNDGNLHTFSANCPNGAALTGGGQSGAVVGVGTPTDGAWQGEAFSTLGSGTSAPAIVYTICASNLGPGAQPTKTQQAANGAASASATVSCPAGQVLVGGAGTSDGPMNTYTSRLSGNGGQWQALSILGGVTGPIALDETAVGVCVTIPD
ncbi:MAG: hypothetical protein ABI068_18140, partial [Ktedonobacterales bacterium]